MIREEDKEKIKNAYNNPLRGFIVHNGHEYELAPKGTTEIMIIPLNPTNISMAHVICDNEIYLDECIDYLIEECFVAFKGSKEFKDYAKGEINRQKIDPSGKMGLLIIKF